MTTKLYCRKTWLLFSSLCFAVFLYAQPTLLPDPEILALGNSSVHLRVNDFAKASLIVSGTESANMSSLYVKLESLSSELTQSLLPDASDKIKAEAVLALLYTKVLFRYSEFQTRIDTALITGDYNCVSSAVLFYYLAASINLQVEAVETPVHAFCTVLIGDKKIDVETTNPYGFDPGAKKELPGTVAAQKRYVLVNPIQYQQRKPVDERRLLALVYNNRISLLQRKSDYRKAVSLALDAYFLQGANAPIKELAECVINYAISLSNAGKDDEGLAFIQIARSSWGDYYGYQEYITVTVANKLNTLTSKNDFQGAFDLLTMYETQIEPKKYAELFRITSSNYVWYLVEKSTLQDALAKIKEFRSSINEAEYIKISVYVYAKEADRISLKGLWLEAVSVLDQGLQILPNQQDLMRQRNMYRQNYAIEVHNTFIEAYNTGNIEKAKSLIIEGLKVIPESTLLKNDLTLFK